MFTAVGPWYGWLMTTILDMDTIQNLAFHHSETWSPEQRKLAFDTVLNGPPHSPIISVRAPADAVWDSDTRIIKRGSAEIQVKDDPRNLQFVEAPKDSTIKNVAVANPGDGDWDRAQAERAQVVHGDGSTTDQSRQRQRDAQHPTPPQTPATVKRS